MSQHPLDEDSRKRWPNSTTHGCQSSRQRTLRWRVRKTIPRAQLSAQVQYTPVGRAVPFRRAWIDEWMLKAQVVAMA